MSYLTVRIDQQIFADTSVAELLTKRAHDQGQDIVDPVLAGPPVNILDEGSIVDTLVGQ